MQVKKFEAPSMKEALEMVKIQLGPEAIILSAKENRKGFGMMSQNSVEVTAAISEMQVRKKDFAETKIPDRYRQGFRNQPARVQNEFIQKATQAAVRSRYGKSGNGSVGDSVGGSARARAGGQSADNNENLQSDYGRSFAEMPQRNEQRKSVIKPVQFRYIDIEDSPARPTVRKNVQNSPPAKNPSSIEISALQIEIKALQEMIQQLKLPVQKSQIPTSQLIIQPSVPQTLSLHPGAELGVPYELSFIFQKMVRVGVLPSLCLKYFERLKQEMKPEDQKRRGLVEAWVARYLLESTMINQSPADGRIHLFVGAAGSGKTSTLVKMASHLMIERRKSVAILTCDSLKVGAVDQLKIFSQILNVPFGVLREPHDWTKHIQTLHAYDYILVDFPGASLKNLEEVDLLMSKLPPADIAVRTHYVQSMTSRDQDASEIARRFQMTAYHDFIFTHVDEVSGHGMILNLQDQIKKPIHSFGFGNKIPEDFEWATRERVLDLIFKITRKKNTELAQGEVR